MNAPSNLLLIFNPICSVPVEDSHIYVLLHDIREFRDFFLYVGKRT